MCFLLMQHWCGCCSRWQGCRTLVFCAGRWEAHTITSSANEWKLSQLLHELVFVPWIQAVWSCTQLRLIFFGRQMVFWVVFWFFSRRGDTDDFGFKWIQKYSQNCSWICLMVGKTFDDKLLIDDHQLFGIIQQPYQILNDVATVSSLMQSASASFSFQSKHLSSVRLLLHLWISCRHYLQSKMIETCRCSGEWLQCWPLTKFHIMEMNSSTSDLLYRNLIFTYLQFPFRDQPWFLTLVKNPGIYFVQVPMPFSSW